MTAEDVKKNLLALPWVKPVKRGTPCDGIKWSVVALHDAGAASRGELPPDHRARCKRKAYFAFKAAKRLRKFDTPATSGNYCQTHASMQVTDYPAERRRADAWWDKNGWWLNGVFGNHSEEV